MHDHNLQTVKSPETHSMTLPTGLAKRPLLMRAFIMSRQAARTHSCATLVVAALFVWATCSPLLRDVHADDPVYCYATIDGECWSGPTTSYDPMMGYSSLWQDWCVTYDCSDGDTTRCTVCTKEEFMLSHLDAMENLVDDPAPPWITNSYTDASCGTINGQWNLTVSMWGIPPGDMVTIKYYVADAGPDGCPGIYDFENWYLGHTTITWAAKSS